MAALADTWSAIEERSVISHWNGVVSPAFDAISRGIGYFLHSIVTAGEMWVHHVTPETKKASMSRRQPSSHLHKKFKTVFN
ncbi:hypothetical protein AVEN_80312-1 [Araneus ventricosus]|uniref:Uncharacterized protein n=1 Tax=Araneus ventricosus TaxID=182803 RepID=A0A4Y2IJG1_ARAVE|nr:hypothetical protein AVEN_80312-1 [Araneus ventricosus]